MNKTLRNDAEKIIRYAIDAVLPEETVKIALKDFKKPNGKTILIAIGKAAWRMAKAACQLVDVDKGLVVTKYDHSQGLIKNLEIIEAGHPTMDENSLLAASKAIELASNLNKDDCLLFLISGGGSALFEKPLISLEKLQDINNQLLKSGADINQINTIRKRLSSIKGGKFAKIAYPGKIINIILSDIIGDPLDMIASGPTYPDSSSTDEAMNIINKYQIKIDDEVKELLEKESIKELDNIETYVTGNNDSLINAAKKKCIELGYEVILNQTPMTYDVSKAVEIFKKSISENSLGKKAIIFGGEITLKVTGNGLGGRNQEFALRMQKEINDENICFFAVGSDGTDGPTDAAGGYIDGTILGNFDEYLENNDAYHALEKIDCLIKTGPTGTNVCDIYCALINKEG